MKLAAPANCFALIFLTAAASFAASGRPAVPKVIDLPIFEARQALIAAGWQPRPTFVLSGVGDISDPYTTLENSELQAGDLYDAGAIEVESCAWTGTAPCNFHYQNGGHCLRVVTDGESPDPEVVEVDDRCPEAEGLTPPRNLNQLGRDYSQAKKVLPRIGWSLAAGEKKDCVATAVATCTFRYVRQKECQVLTVGIDKKKWGPETVVLHQEEGCPAAPKR